LIFATSEFTQVDRKYDRLATRILSFFEGNPPEHKRRAFALVKKITPVLKVWEQKRESFSNKDFLNYPELPDYWPGGNSLTEHRILHAIELSTLMVHPEDIASAEIVKEAVKGCQDPGIDSLSAFFFVGNVVDFLERLAEQED